MQTQTEQIVTSPLASRYSGADTPSLRQAKPESSAAAKPSGCPMHTLFGSGRGGESGGPAGRIGVFAFGLVAYVMFAGTITYAIGFVTGLAVPKTINSGEVGPVGWSLLINAAMLTAFVVQHTIMARPAFKRWWTRFVPASIERSIFVAAASAILMLTFWQWRPVPYIIWDFSMYPVVKYGLLAIALAGWGIVLLASFMVSHFDLFGLRQVWFKLRGRRYEHVEFRLVGLYKLVRHPLMVGFLIAFWSTATMTIGHLFFATLTTLYIVFGTWIEERDLLYYFGDTYREYQRRVRAFVPIPRSAD